MIIKLAIALAVVLIVAAFAAWAFLPARHLPGNPWADSAVVADPLALPTAPDDHFATYATLYQLDPGAKVRMQQSSGASIGPRFGYFGGYLRDAWIVALAARYQVVRRFSGPRAKARRDGFINGLPAAVLSRAAGPGPARDQHPHRQLPSPASAEHTAVQPGGQRSAPRRADARPCPWPGRQDRFGRPVRLAGAGVPQLRLAPSAPQPYSDAHSPALLRVQQFSSTAPFLLVSPDVARWFPEGDSRQPGTGASRFGMWSCGVLVTKPLYLEEGTWQRSRRCGPRPRCYWSWEP
jgi:hypothetical protein